MGKVGTALASKVALGPLSAVSLREQVRRLVRASIIAGDFEPGSIYSIPQLAERFSVSVTPVREALLDLATEGIVEIVRNRGFLVPVLSADDLDELVQLRLMLEVASVRLLAGLESPPDWQPLRSLATRIRLYAEHGDVVGFLQIDRDFHLGMLEYVGNRRLLEIVGRLRDHTRLYGLRSATMSGHMMPSLLEHDALLDAIEARDAATAAEVMTHHLQHARGIWAGEPEWMVSM